MIGCNQSTKKNGAFIEEVHLQHVPDTITLSADYAILMDMNTGDILYGKNMDARTSTASLTKMMTCILAIEKGDMTEKVTLTDTCLKHSFYFEKDKTWTLRQALQEMMMISDNGTAYTVANHLSSPDTSFIDLMNLKARELGLKDTHFMNPVGFYDSAHYSTARDMAKLACYCMKDSLFRTIVATKYDSMKLGKKTPFIDTCKNTNDLLHDYDGCIGIKTGHIEKAGFCIAVAATRGNRSLIAIVMNAPDRETRNADARRLLDEGFKLQTLKPGEILPDAKGVVTPIDTVDSSTKPAPSKEKKEKKEKEKEKPKATTEIDNSEDSDITDSAEKSVQSKDSKRSRHHRHHHHHHHRHRR